LLLLAPVAVVFFKDLRAQLRRGLGNCLDGGGAISALSLSLLMAAIAVPLNTVFRVGAALIIVHTPRWTCRAVLDALIDLPFLVSPVAVGLAHGARLRGPRMVRDLVLRPGAVDIYAVPMALATVFVSLPAPWCERSLRFIAEIGDRQEAGCSHPRRTSRLADVLARHAAFRSRWGVAYGVILSTARALEDPEPMLVISSLGRWLHSDLPPLVFERASQPGAGLNPSPAAYLPPRPRHAHHLPGRAAGRDRPIAPGHEVK
jgi:sulfate transport system permease protein